MSPDRPYAPDCAPPNPKPRAPSFAVPQGACDAHAHIIGDPRHYPMVAERSYTPPEADVGSYRHLLSTLGLERAVIVQPSFYGTDNRCTRDALRTSEGAWRGVAVLDPEADPRELKALHEDGFRGARINLLFAGGVSIESMERIARRVAPMGWHLQLLIDIRSLPDILGRIEALPCDVVFDHVGHFPAALGPLTKGFAALQRLLDKGRTWVKLSGGYRLSTLQPPYPDVGELARRLVAQRPDRLVWGSDWPHTATSGLMPNDGELLDALAHWVPEQTTRDRILVNNPAVLYQFGAA